MARSQAPRNQDTGERLGQCRRRATVPEVHGRNAPRLGFEFIADLEIT